MTDKKQNLVEIAKKKRHLALIEKMQKGALTKQEITELEEFEQGFRVRRTIKGVAKAMKVSYRTVQRWKRENMPVTKDGLYDLDIIKEWRDTKDGLLSQDEIEGRAHWQAETFKHRARLLEIEVKKAEDELVLRKEVEKGWNARILAVKAEFLALPDRIAPLLAMKEAREIKTILYESLAEITDEFAGVKR